jgi:hypothetical protein
MPTLAELQASLAQRLTGDPAAETDPHLSRAARALQHKRMRAVAQLLPRTRKAVGPDWSRWFSQHAARYTPSGLLYHVDDAWEFCLAQAGSSNRAIRRAAQIDLAWLNLRFDRSVDRGAKRLRERTGFYFSVTVDPIVVSLRVPGRRPRVFASSH